MTSPTFSTSTFTLSRFLQAVQSMEHAAQGIALRAQLMSTGVAGVVLGTLLYFWLTRRGLTLAASSLVGFAAGIAAGAFVLQRFVHVSTSRLNTMLPSFSRPQRWAIQQQ